MSQTYRVEIRPLPRQAQDQQLLRDIAALGIPQVRRVERFQLYFLHGDLSEFDVALLCTELLGDPITEETQWMLAAERIPAPPGTVRVEVGLRQGVMDSVADNLLARARLLGVESLHAVASAQSYLLFGDLEEEQVRRIAQHLLCNDVIQYYQVGTLHSHVGLEPPPAKARVEVIPLRRMTDEELLGLSRARLLSLDLAEMCAIRSYFAAEGRDPTDAELESLAQTWSEHCVHKTFKGVIEYTEKTARGTTHERIDGLIKTYLQAATQEIEVPWVRSAFVDNAGIVAFTEDYDVSFKVETHNHPSALEPFGGANTGVGGVVRDIIGVSARPIANTDVLCFGLLDIEMEQLPAGVLHPRRVYNGVIAGIEDYGNKMGIPTVNGAIFFDPGYTANPLVYCGCVGLAPKGVHPSAASRRVQPGDLVVVLGGRTGRDGLHGATFSSAELTAETGEIARGAVQIGNPITEKMMLDAILAARGGGDPDQRLYHAITDCGAGGLSSAVSEMGEETGVIVHLEKVPLKYQGLQPWEIWLSEAQERMVLAVPPENEARLRRICERFSVEMTVIGEFTGDGRLRLRYHDLMVADMAMEFLHHGLPRRTLRAVWEETVVTEADGPASPSGDELADILLRILAHPNVHSKEDVVRRYDHEVQGGTVIKPLVGVRSDGPSDAAVLKPLEIRDSWQGIALGCGFNPAYGEIDPYAMAISAIDEAVRNVVAVGADPDRIAILDNFCWGNPALPDRLGSLVRACKGCYDGALHYRTPFISGKDSLNNEYTDRATGQQVAIPPSLLISALGIVPDVRRACTMDLKSPGDLLYILGETRLELGGSYYHRLRGLAGGSVPGLAPTGPATARALHRAIRSGLVRACHDCSEGGLAVALAEMALAGGLGAEVSLAALPTSKDLEWADDGLLFAESNGRYLVEVSPEQAKDFETMMEGVPYARLGQVTDLGLTVRGCGGNVLFSLSLEAIRWAWRGHLEETHEAREAV